MVVQAQLPITQFASRTVDLQSLLRRFSQEGSTEELAARALPLVSEYRKDGGVLVKVGGSALSKQYGEIIFGDINILYRDLGIPLILVHGGGKEIDAEMKSRGLTITRVKGRRVTDSDTIDVLEKVMPRIGEEIVTSLTCAGIPAVHILGNKGVLETERMSEELGYVGVVKEVNVEEIIRIARGRIPVITPLGFSGDQVYNINADTASSAIAGAMHARKILFVTDVNGFFDGHVWRAEVSVAEARKLIREEKISGGMVPKAEAATEAAENFNIPASVINGSRPGSILEHLFGYNGFGTEIIPKTTRER